MDMQNVNNVSKSLKMACGLCIVAVVIALGLASFFYAQTVQLKRDPQQIGQERANQVLERLSQIIAVPADEEPTVAEVTDPSLLKDHPFLAKAKKGDFVIIYPKAQKAYLYDPLAHKIIDVGSVTPPAETAPESATSEAPVVK